MKKIVKIAVIAVVVILAIALIAPGQDRRHREARGQCNARRPAGFRETRHQPAAPFPQRFGGTEGADAGGRRPFRRRHDRRRTAYFCGRQSDVAFRRQRIRGDEGHPRLAGGACAQTRRRSRQLGRDETLGGSRGGGSRRGARAVVVPAFGPRLPHFRRGDPLRGRFDEHAVLDRAPLAASPGQHVGRPHRPRPAADGRRHAFRVGRHSAVERRRGGACRRDRRRPCEQPLHFLAQYAAPERHFGRSRRLGRTGRRRRGHGPQGRLRQGAVQGRAVADPGLLHP